MSSERVGTAPGIEAERGADDGRATVRLLVSDPGNRAVIREMLEDHFEVETGETVGEADLYLVEDHLFPKHREALRERVERAHPVFCPVVLIRRATTELADPTRDAVADEGPMLIDDVVDAPIDRSLLIRRLHSVLVRRRQSRELSEYVSTLERREQKLRRFERGVESTGNAILMTGRSGEITYVNPAFEELTGYAEADVTGATPATLQPAGVTDVFTEGFWRTMLDREEWNGEVVLEHGDGGRSVADTSITAIHDDDGEVEGFVVVMADITERIQQEEELQRHEDELERLRQILTRYLRHNLRNDLNVVLGHAEMLAGDESLSEDQRRKAEKIVEMAGRLDEKSDTARKYSRLLRQNTDLSTHDLSEIVRDSVRAIGERYPDVAFDLSVPDRCEIRARAGVRDAVDELVENAAEHANPDSPHVSVRLHRANGARLVVEDDGSGIPEVEVRTLESDEETPLAHSQGIGLWLSKWLIESSDGHLSFDLLDPGTRVVVDFPPPQHVGSGRLDVSTLKEREQRLQTVIDRMTDAVVEVDASWEITFVDPRAEEILDLSADEVQGEAFWAVFPDFRETEFEAVYREVMETRSSRHVESYYDGIDGWLSVYVYPEFDGGLSFYFRDTTERNRRTRELGRARSRMELALEVTDSTVWEWDVATDSVTTHPEVHTAFGTRITTGEAFLAAIHPADRARVRDALETTVETGTAFSVEYRVRSGEETRWVEDYGELGRDRDGSKRVIGIAGETTERKERERELQRYRTVTEAANDTILTMDESGTIRSATPAVEETFGYEPEELVGEPVTTLMSEETARRHRTAVQRYLETGERSVDWNDAEFVGRHRDGTPVPVAVSFGETTFEGERFFVGTIRDVTERTEREREVRAAGARLRNAVEAGAVGTWEWDLRTDEFVANREFADAVGLDPDRLEAGVDPERVLSRIHDDDREAVEREIEGAVASGDDYEAEYRVRDAAGEKRWVLARGRVAEAEDGTPVTLRGVLVDITDRKRAEQELQRHNDYLDEFAGVVSHDLRNPLNVVEGRVELARADCDSEHLDAIESAARRMDRIIDDLLWLAREGRDIRGRDTVAVRTMIDDAWTIVADGAPGATVRDGDDALGGTTLEADPDRLAQLFENLLRNAIEHGGENVTVTVGRLDDGFYLEDDGPGIPEGEREAVFDAGYSTRTNGTGFGLRIVRQVAEAHGWAVRVTEGTDGGARFEVTGVDSLSK